MEIEFVVYLAIGWLTVIAFLFMLLILNIHRVELNNSKRHLNLKMAMHYHHMFHRMRIAFEKQNMFSQNEVDKPRDIMDIIKENARTFQDGLVDLSYELSRNCENNEFLFISDDKLRKSLILKCNNLLTNFDSWKNNYRNLERDVIKKDIDDLVISELSIDTWDDLTMRYNHMIAVIIDVHNLLNNETYLDIVQPNKIRYNYS